ncbi:MAG: DUF2769 domain-containing protein [Alphaproteobacteria bacterium]|nr:DUF2769 domain-containing protein [Alphaproteobacteria bacterium]MBO5441860.1 DUF2769 domain-containing protein [Alphaproteobacteria bacterium]MBP3687272.1 DUF2769 domain-containing protein [Alphaproteobacteria bacterium]
MHVEKTIDNAKSCLCLGCPSYTTHCKMKNSDEIALDMSHINDTAHMELMFCAFEKSNCIHENRGCLCQDCPVHKKYQLNNEDYCLNTGGIL